MTDLPQWKWALAAGAVLVVLAAIVVFAGAGESQVSGTEAPLLDAGGTAVSMPPLPGEWFGIGDPSVIDGSGASEVYASFSDIAPAHSKGGPVLVGVALARSRDGGSTWERAGSVAPGRQISDDTLEMNEISSLVYDRADPAAPYKVLWLRFLNVNEKPDFVRSWVAMKTAAMPVGEWSEPQKLIAGAAYDPNDPSHPEPRKPLFDLPTEMQDCAVLMEPATLGAEDGFYMAINCVNPFKKDIDRLSLLKFTHPVPGQMALAYIGTLITKKDAERVARAHRGRYPELKAMEELGAVDLFEAGGRTYLLASPVRGTGEYMGCGVFEVEDIASARVKRDENGVPEMLAYIQGIEGTHRGACTYSPRLTETGVLMFQVTPTPGSIPPISFEVVATGAQIP